MKLTASHFILVYMVVNCNFKDKNEHCLVMPRIKTTMVGLFGAILSNIYTTVA